MVATGDRPRMLDVSAGVGGLLLGLSAVLPWSTSESLISAHLSPLATEGLRPSVILVLLIGVAGAIGWTTRRTTAAWIGLAGTLWLTFATVIWFAGARIKVLLPSSVLPEGAVMSTQPGLLAGLLGGVILMSVAVLDALHLDGSTQLATLRPLPTLSAIVLVGGLWWGFSDPWFQVDAQGHTWTLGLDAAPLLGDVIAPLIIGASLLLVWAALAPQRVALAIGAVAGGLLAVIALGIWLSATAGASGATATLRRIGAGNVVDDVHVSGRGPVVLAVFSIGTTTYCLARCRERRRHLLSLPQQPPALDDLPY